jgi:hypothetical protein
MAKGGVRIGAGRPKGSKGLPKGLPAPQADLDAKAAVSPIELLLSVVNDGSMDLQTRLRCAIAAAPFVHERKLGVGKKESKAESAKVAAAGKYAAGNAPKLAVVK